MPDQCGPPAYPTLFWISPEQAAGLDFNTYWNDEEIESGKEFYVLDGDFRKMEDYLRETGLPGHIESCLARLRSKHGMRPSGTGIDVAAGCLWSAPYFLRDDAVRAMYFLEYSTPRLLKLGPVVLDHYGIPRDKATLVYGSFYDIELPDGSVDFVFMAQALHHAKNPIRLLREIRRILKPGGLVIVVGEHVVDQDALPPPDETLGDHYYTDAQYYDLFRKTGFSWDHVRHQGALFQSFLLFPEPPQGGSPEHQA